MTVTIHPKDIVLTKGCRTMMNSGQGAYCDPRTVEYCNRIGLNHKYFLLVTTGRQ